VNVTGFNTTCAWTNASVDTTSNFSWMAILGSSRLG